MVVRVCQRGARTGAMQVNPDFSRFTGDFLPQSRKRVKRLLVSAQAGTSRPVLRLVRRSLGEVGSSRRQAARRRKRQCVPSQGRDGTHQKKTCYLLFTWGLATQQRAIGHCMRIMEKQVPSQGRDGTHQKKKSARIPHRKSTSHRRLAPRPVRR